MKTAKSAAFVAIVLMIAACNPAKKEPGESLSSGLPGATALLPLDKGFSEYISGYTSGIIPANGVIEIHFTQSFAEAAKKETPSGLFVFEPQIRGRAEWTDEYTLVFTPSKTLTQGTVYTGELALHKLGEVKERLRSFPLRIQTVRKDFRVTPGRLECSSDNPGMYEMTGELSSSDYVDPSEAESWVSARLNRKKLSIEWDHSENPMHRFVIKDIRRNDKPEDLLVEWDGSSSGIKQKGSFTSRVPAIDIFTVISARTLSTDPPQIELVFSDAVDVSQELEGLIYTVPATALTISTDNNIVLVSSAEAWEGNLAMNIEKSVRNAAGNNLSEDQSFSFDFTRVNPSIEFIGKGVIIPASENLVFPFRTAGLKAVDLKIIRIFENNLPWFLQENEINSGYYVKRFGRPVYAGRVDLVTDRSTSAPGWSTHTIDLSDYIDVEPGVLYKVQLGMRKSYTSLDCGLTDEEERYEEMLDRSMELSGSSWDDPDIYYDDESSSAYYSAGFSWRDRNDPCKGAYYSPNRNPSKNILASNIGLIARKGEDKRLHVSAFDLLTTKPIADMNIEVLDFQLQKIADGMTGQDGSASLFCGRTPFLLIAKSSTDRNYLKLNEGNSLSMSSFDVSGVKPENGIKAFIYGERDVWRPGDSIFLGVMIRDMKSDLPPDHPVIYELTNPLGQRVDNQVLKTSGNSLIAIKSITPSDAVTGNYNATFRIGGSAFTKRIRIETIKPNRLKLDLMFAGEMPGTITAPATGTLNVKWLNGTTAKNLKASVEYLLRPVKTEFNNYHQFIFDDPASGFYAETVNLFDGETDQNGNASLRFDPDEEMNAPGMMNAIFTIRAMEPGGDESITQSVWKYAPYKVFAGINLPGLQGKGRMLFTDAENEVRIVTVDQKGNPVRTDANINVYKLTYRWWWESDDDDLAHYVSNSMYKPVLSEKIVTSQSGEAVWKFTLDRRQWGRYLIRVTTPGGHSSGRIVLIDWPWEYGMKENTEGATLLAVSTDKEKYAPGDEIKLSFPAPENSRAIIALGNATGMLDEIRVDASGGNTEVSFKATPEMAPNVYAWVSVIQPHSQTVNDMPIRLYGIVPVMVEDPGTRLTPVIEAPGEIRSHDPLTINVSEAGKKAMTYTVAIVDEGLLDITGFKTPDPWNYFYAREALGLRTWDMYDMVLGAFGATLDKAFATGGDDMLADRSSGKANRFVPVVRFLGPFSLGTGKTNTHQVNISNYTGSVKAMVIACNERAFGSADRSVTVKDPMMVLVTAPRMISPGEKAALPVNLFVQKDGIGEVTLTAETNSLLSLENNSLNLNANRIGEHDRQFVFTAGEKTGVASIKVTATGGGETASYELELQVRNPNPVETRSELKILQKGEKWETSFEPFGIAGSNTAALSASSMPSVNLDKQLDYLVGYPHGCSEQITSGAFPQLLLKNLVNNPAAVADAEKNTREAIRLLVTRQMTNGGIALWPGAMTPDSWVTSYSGHFMLEAERQGFNIPRGFRQRWLAYQKKASHDWRFDSKFRYSANDQAYRLFTLAYAGQPDKGAMNRLRESKDLPALSRWLLAAAFSVSGRPEAAEELIDVRALSTEQEAESYFYGSAVRDKAVILYSLVMMNKHEEALPLLTEICDNFNSGGWYSTQSLAWGLFSYMKYTETLPGSGGKAAIKTTLNGTAAEYGLAPKQISLTNLEIREKENNLVVENTGESPVFINLTQKGIPLLSDATGEEKGLGVTVEYLDMEMRPVNHRMLNQGTDFMMVIKVKNNTYLNVDNIALTNAVPSGWEIRNTRLFETTTGIKESMFHYRDFRDDRVNTYFSLRRGETKTFVHIMNAAYRGEFFRPAIWCEAMYNENCYSRIAGEKVIVAGE